MYILNALYLFYGNRTHTHTQRETHTCSDIFMICVHSMLDVAAVGGWKVYALTLHGWTKPDLIEWARPNDLCTCVCQPAARTVCGSTAEAESREKKTACCVHRRQWAFIWKMIFYPRLIRWLSEQFDVKYSRSLGTYDSFFFQLCGNTNERCLKLKNDWKRRTNMRRNSTNFILLYIFVSVL